MDLVHYFEQFGLSVGAQAEKQTAEPDEGAHHELKMYRVLQGKHLFSVLVS